MSETDPPRDDNEDPELDFDAEIAGEDDSSTALVAGSIGLALLVVLGVVGYLSGVGWFGYRQWLYGEGELYLANYSLEEHSVSVDGREPVTLAPHTYEIVSIVGGTSSLEIRGPSGDTPSRHTIETDHSDAFFKVAGEECLVASDVSSFYGPSQGRLEFVAFLRRDQRRYVPQSHNVIWPGTDFPNQLDAGEGPGIWIEKVGCNHLKHRGAMRAYLQVRLRDRLNLRGDEPSNPRRPRPGK